MPYFKAFNQDLTCRNFQFEIGKTYRIKGKPIMCMHGFHCCINPLNCLHYYLSSSRFCEVEVGGKTITEGGKTVAEEITVIREIVGKEKDALLTGNCTWSNRDQMWFFNGERHREGDQPAIVRPDGTKEWWFNGVRYREGDQPAIVRPDGTKEWYYNGKRHREGDQPAIVRASGSKDWWYDGKLLWWHNGELCKPECLV